MALSFKRVFILLCVIYLLAQFSEVTSHRLLYAREGILLILWMIVLTLVQSVVWVFSELNVVDQLKHKK